MSNFKAKMHQIRFHLKRMSGHPYAMLHHTPWAPFRPTMIGGIKHIDGALSSSRHPRFNHVCWPVTLSLCLWPMTEGDFRSPVGQAACPHITSHAEMPHQPRFHNDQTTRVNSTALMDKPTSSSVIRVLPRPPTRWGEGGRQ